MRAFGRLAVVVVAGVALAGCGGSSSSSPSTTTSGTTGGTTSSTTGGTTSGATSGTTAAQAKIQSAYEQFFSDNTSVPQKVKLLANGPRFQRLIFSFSNNPLARRAKVEISSIKLTAPDRADVVYQIHFASASLPTKTGTAVKQSGRWKVGDATLCQLVAMQGTVPSVCKP
jgi:hypothetical protein